MRIAELTAYHVRIPLLRKVRHASHTRSDTDSIVVCCRLDDGTEGWGEGLPREYVTGETIDTAIEQFRSTAWNSQLGEALVRYPDAIRVCDQIELAGSNGDERDRFGNSLRCAVEIAILDAIGRATGRPLSDVAAMVPESIAIRRTSDRVMYSAAITPMGALREIARALRVWYYEFKHGKVKVGVEGVDDVAALKRLRWILGPMFDLRIDANEAWHCGELEAKVAPLVKAGITSLEQPVPHSEVDGLAALRSRLGVPIMLDESLCSLSDGQRAIERGTCDLFNIRLSKCGGFLRSLRLAAMAHCAGLGYQLGCQVGETGILSAAGRMFATSIGGLRYLEGSFDRFLVSERLTVEDLTFGRGGWAPALTGPGLGVQIDRNSLDRVTVAKEVRRVA